MCLKLMQYLGVNDCVKLLGKVERPNAKGICPPLVFLNSNKGLFPNRHTRIHFVMKPLEAEKASPRWGSDDSTHNEGSFTSQFRRD